MAACRELQGVGGVGSDFLKDVRFPSGVMKTSWELHGCTTFECNLTPLSCTLSNHYSGNFCRVCISPAVKHTHTHIRKVGNWRGGINQLFPRNSLEGREEPEEEADLGCGTGEDFLRGKEMLVHLDAGVKDPESGLILGRQEGGKPRRDLGGNMGSRSGLRGPGAGITPHLHSLLSSRGSPKPSLAFFLSLSPAGRTPSSLSSGMGRTQLQSPVSRGA